MSGQKNPPRSRKDYAELVAATNFSFLRGASHPSEMVGQAMALGMTAIGIADRNSVAGVVRAYVALRDAPELARAAMLEAKKESAGEDAMLNEEEERACGTRDFLLVVGARLVFADGTPDIVAYPATRPGWGRLTRLLTTGNLRAKKGGCILRFEDLLDHLDDLLLIVLSASTAVAQEAHRKPVDYALDLPPRPQLSLVAPQGLEATIGRLAGKAPGRVWLGAAMHRSGSDARELARLTGIARDVGVPLIATNDVIYATPEQRSLHDILTCIREGKTIFEAGRALEANAERHLKSPDEMTRLFKPHPEAIAETQAFISRIAFTLDDLRYEYPHEPVPEGWEPQAWLKKLVWQAARKRYPEGIPDKMRRLLREELGIIGRLGFAYYFLTVHDLVAFARGKGILCQGRGSAANSAVCYLLGITSIDPAEHNLLFARFISEERKEPPDIDVDFEHERREEVMQEHIYARYGRHRAGIAATVIHYRPRSAVREVGKALGLTEDITARMVGTVWGSWSGDYQESRIAEAGFAPDNPQLVRLRSLVDQLLKFPRHLSQHVGGFVLTEGRLDELVPIHNGAMEKRTFIEWDKDDIDALQLMKVDVLALGMLTCIRKCFDLMRAHGLGDHGLDTVPHEDPAVYDMLCKGDSIGVFQVESRAQINMLPRMRPREFYDLVIQVAIVRPGPIEGDMVHPYLRRRNKEEEVELAGPPGNPDELKEVLGKTLGVPLFQEQAMRLAITAAEFSDADANKLRRAMATFRNVGTIQNFQEKLVEGMVRRGYDRDFAARCYGQIKGFGSYGFPESHAFSFARLVYVSSWIKCHHPAIFACGLLNSQPMGFYAPAQLIPDASDHGVQVREADINASAWDNSLERGADGELSLRIGLRQIDGFGEDWANAIATARAVGPFASLEDLARRGALPRRALRLLASADACRSIGLDRREALWEARRLPGGELPLFAAAQARELADEPDARLPVMPRAEHVVADYQTTRLSLKGHPMEFLRDRFAAEGVLSCEETSNAKNGAKVRTAGVVLIRQRPGKGNAIFITIEDETGITNILLWARLFESQRRAVMASRLILVEGEVQRSKEGVVHLMATRVTDRTAELARLTDAGHGIPPAMPGDMQDQPYPPRHGHPRDVRILPRSRDFH